jgi:mono/diheme cytochrome c family protein
VPIAFPLHSRGVRHLIFAVLLASCSAAGTSLPAPRADHEVDALAAQGQELFFGRAGCITCHRLGEQGDRTVGPNLGASAAGDHIAARARVRRPDLRPIEYIVESMLDPNAVVAPGYQPGVMRRPEDPPVSLRDDEILAVATFLARQEGVNPPETSIASARAKMAAMRRARERRVAHEHVDQACQSLWTGDVEQGAALYAELSCGSCHGNTGDAALAASPLQGVSQRRSLPEVARWILGPPPGRMPAYGGELTHGELAHLLAYLESLE